MEVCAEVVQNQYRWAKGTIRVLCCDEMKDAWEARIIGMGDYDGYGNSNTDVNLYEHSCFPEGLATTRRPIRFCPFCGNEIEVVISRVQPYAAR